MRLLVCCLTFLFFVANQQKSANAFFTENYKKNIMYGAFKRPHTADVYFHLQAGFVVKMWGPNFSTALMSDSKILHQYIDAIGEKAVGASLSSKYTYSVDFAVGFFLHESRFRHELLFKWYSLATDAYQLTGNTASIKGTTYDFASLQGKYISEMGAYADVYKIMYCLVFDVKDAFNLLKTNWDIYFSVAGGFAIIKSGACVGREIKTSQDGNSANYSVVNNNYSVANAEKYALDKKLSLGVGFAFETGAIANISQSFAASVAFSFEGTSRPLLDGRFKVLDGYSGAKKTLDYHVALKIGILLKAFDVML